jgi:hypothetical protein
MLDAAADGRALKMFVALERCTKMNDFADWTYLKVLRHLTEVPLVALTHSYERTV